MNQWLIAPAVLPALTASVLVLALRHSLAAQRTVSLGATALLVAIAAGLFWVARAGEPMPYLLGDWPAPFGIVLVVDRLSTTMLLLAAVLALFVLVYAVNGWDARGRHFHALFHFQLLGINGAFLTGDIFNLFVFFEVMLIASYGLMLHGGGARRLKAGFQYVTVNLIGSVVFLFAVGLIYAVTGTLNMADLAVKVPQVQAGDRALLSAGAALLLGVFVLKASLVPLHWWLPIAYAAAPAPAAALFAILTKVGAYSIIRVFGLVLGGEDGGISTLAGSLLVPAAIVTLAVGALGTLASRNLLDLVCFAVVASMGTLLIPLGLFRSDALGGGLYYLLHSTVIAAALFLLVDLVAERRGRLGDALRPGPMRQQPLLAGLFLVAAVALVGMPPLSGFVGKLLILESSRAAGQGAAVWGAILVSSLVLLAAFARSGSLLFWKSPPSERAPAQGAGAVPVLCLAGLLALTVLLSVFAGPVMAELGAVAEQAGDREGYVRAVLGSVSGARSGAS
ncbi:MAG: monovalent cation/H+ antiporter subunit D [Alphaproteobacteria bacterium]|nr:monovalent cation/H+ antiporter subunit D [Alphaproteobacteria bacterium]